MLAAAMALVHDETTFYLVRFLLGVAEAGLFPGVVPYLTYWFPARARWSRPSGVLVAFWPLPTALLSPAVAATGIAMINSLGNLGGFSGPYAVGFLQDRTGSFLPGLVLLSFLAELGGLVAILVTRRPR